MKQLTSHPAQAVLQPADSKRHIDAFLNPYLAQKTEQAKQLDPSYAALWGAIDQLYHAGGKRLRSYMTLLVHQAYSDQPIEDILPAAAAQELLHLAMLIHDDIIDRDLIRYGTNNLTAQYRTFYESLLTDESDRHHFAESAAILAGDLLLSESYMLCADAAVPTERIIESQKVLGSAVFTVIGGELLDTEASFKATGAAHPLVIAEQKTASYSFVSPFLMGARLANAPQEDQEILAKLGQHMGIAYQLRDDIIGVFGNEAATGKSAEGDIREGKRTILIAEFERLAHDHQKQRFFEIFGDSRASSEAIAEARTLLQASGALQALEDTIQGYVESAQQMVASLHINDTNRTAFQQLIHVCLQRER